MARAGEILALIRGLPLARLDQITKGENIMVLAPHPDDESLGCGGLIAQACALNRPPVVVILTDGTGSHPSSLRYPIARLRDLREQESRQAVRILGLPPERIYFLGFRDTAAPTIRAGVRLCGECDGPLDAHLRLPRSLRTLASRAAQRSRSSTNHCAIGRQHDRSSLVLVSSMGLDTSTRCHLT